jgi:hypothetical protein
MSCDHCQVRQAKINTGIDRNPSKTIQRLRCWVCYATEQRMSGTSDWRDSYQAEFAKTHDMVQRENETQNNLYNRCKRLVMKSGFKL